MPIAIIIAVIVGLSFGYAIAIVYQEKQRPSLDTSPQTPPELQNVSYLEEKIWYESELNLLFKFSEKLSITTGYKKVAQCITETVHNFLPVERSVLLIRNRDTQALELACAIGWKSASGSDFVIQNEESISGVVMRRKEALIVKDLQKDDYLKTLNKEDYLQKAFISVPLLFQKEILGVIHVCDKRSPGDFAQREASVVTDIARLGAMALQNAWLYEEMSKRAVELKMAYDELKEMQDKLIQSEKLKAIGQMASGVAHEMRNPIGIIMQGLAYMEQTISRKTKEPGETLSIVKESAQRADRIVTSLLDFSRATRLELHPEYVDSILESSLNLVKTELKNIEVVREIQGDLPKVLVDRNKLIQVFINLFMNAKHAMPEAGKLTIRSFAKQLEETRNSSIEERLDYSFEAGEKVVVVEIEDTGIGISKENLKKIFDPFFTTKGMGKGTGLGLSLSRNIIIMHKGLIEVESEEEKGTRVIITLRISK
ncbi:MAG: ATP-binding protein [Candidatus Omnitrophota bacterium]|jgi:signal transduction histidine kinase